jgi:NAD(P)H dehydrogenase (quinone)
MKHAIIVAHPRRNSFTMAAAGTYRDAVLEQKHDVVFRDLYSMKFDPCLYEDEIPWASDFTTHPDVAEERRAIEGADVFAFFYPLWLNMPPAMLKGYLERVFGLGFAYGRGKGGNEPLLRNRKLISFSSSGAPTDWVIQSGAWAAVRTLFDTHFAAVCGLDVIDHVHFGSIVPGVRPDSIAKHLETVRQKVAAYF